MYVFGCFAVWKAGGINGEKGVGATRTETTRRVGGGKTGVCDRLCVAPGGFTLQSGLKGPFKSNKCCLLYFR